MKNDCKRRSFIKNAGILSSSVLFPGIISCRPQKHSLSTDKLGVALVGLGTYSTYSLAPALQFTKYCELRGIVTGTPAKIPVWQEKYGIADAHIYDYDNMYQIASNDDIDIVYIVVPTALHSKYAVIAANAGKHVWCEKPMGLNVSQCQTIIDACNKNQVKLSIGYRMQHEPNTQRINAFRVSRPFGKIVSIVAEAGYRGGGGSGWRFQKNMGGGALYDMGVYTINGIRHALGEEPVSVLNAKQIVKRPDLFKEVDETTEYELEFASGVKAKGWTSVGENRNILRVDCEKGWYQLSPMQTYNGVIGSTSKGDVFQPISDMQQTRQMDDDARAIMDGTEVLAPGEDGIADVRIIEAIIKSAATNSRVLI